ncbi:ribosomal-protein-alanine N-acetyltransferase [Paenibacillus favisporus]|uniref:Ribosomal-protein-alanine N-acetyltransferase n=1 Tax=Paenibacillus favisporus TaxID=221028 RepID=A0ABV2FCY8_9BACL|nr:GNAT family N-acetyltransferase [Paenibacillus cellulositrophicus]MCM2996222.1 GNAT family N-acetyltransferase [Paenibacillus cellulositrophicus]
MMDVGKLFSSPPIFETARLRIRRLELSDAADYFELASNPDVSAETVWDRHHSIEETIDYLNRVNQRFDMKQAIHWGIIEKASGKLIGRTGLIHVDPVHEKAEIGYALARAYWSQGFVTEATREIVHYAFVQAGFHRLEARCNASNPGSYRVMEKLGMSFEGVLREQLKIKGQFVDQRMYSILRQDTEWSV